MHVNAQGNVSELKREQPWTAAPRERRAPLACKYLFDGLWSKFIYSLTCLLSLLIYAADIYSHENETAAITGFPHLHSL